MDLQCVLVLMKLSYEEYTVHLIYSLFTISFLILQYICPQMFIILSLILPLTLFLLL